MLGKKDGERGGLCRIPLLLIALWKWIKIIVRKDYDIIHYNFALDRNAIIRDFFFITFAYKSGCKMVLHLHGGKYLTEDCDSALLNYMQRRIFGYGLPIIVLGEHEKAMIEKRFRVENVFVLPNPVVVPEQKNKDFGHNSPLHLLYLGRIERQKGMDEMLDAFELLRKESKGFVLHFAGKEQGSENYIEKFSSLLGDNFIYEGVVAGDKKNALLQQCHIFLLPSHFEGLPMSLLEAMSYSLVPVVTNVGSIGDYVKDNENGIVVSVGEGALLAQKLSMLMSDKSLIEDLSRKSYETIRQHFHNVNYVKSLMNIYTKELIACANII